MWGSLFTRNPFQEDIRMKEMIEKNQIPVLGLDFDLHIVFSSNAQLTWTLISQVNFSSYDVPRILQKILPVY